MTDAPDSEVAVVRSEEQLRIETRRVDVGRAVLRKTVVTEERTISIQVRHEEAHLEVVPFDTPRAIDVDRGASHLALPEFILHREEIVVTRRLVPIERVRLHVDQIQEQQTVTGDLRHEQVVLDRGEGDTTDPES